MKTNLILAGMLLVGLFAMSFAMAEENATVSIDSNGFNKCFGSTDGISKCGSINQSLAEIDASLNESVSGWKIGGHKIKIWFTFDKEKKAEKEIKLAEMRLIQARNAARNNNTIAMEKALKAHERLLEKVKERVQNINGAKDSNGIKDSVEKLVGLDRAIEVHQIKIDRMSALLENENLTADEKARIENALERAQNKITDLQEIQIRQMEKMRTKLLAIGNMTENESKDIISKIEDAQNLNELREIRNEMKEGYQFKVEAGEREAGQFGRK